METQAGHRIISFQLESQVLRGVDAEADRAAAFALRVIAAIDGRALPPVEGAGRTGVVRPKAPGRAVAGPKAPRRAAAGPKATSHASR